MDLYLDYKTDLHSPGPSFKLALTKAGVDATRFSGHSFRIGAATTAAANGVSDAMIQILGWWKSDSYCRYIHTPRQQLTSLSKLLSQ